MLDTHTRALVKATAPVLKEHGVVLMRHFYARLFEHNPELKEVFNQGHQNAGSQQQALAMAVAAYATHIDNPSALMPVLERVANKHVSLGIRAEHYPIVGKHLLASISEVLGEAATPALIDAWAAAYGKLADVLIGMERRLFGQATQQAGGWSGWRSFRVQQKTQESAEIHSFHLVPADGGAVPPYKPGQYVSVRVHLPALGYRQPRQYSLSAAPGGASLRISVKREAAGAQADTPQGMVSNHLHQQVQANDVVEVSQPAGDFFLHEDRQTPVVLISAGVGVTPMMAMLEQLASQGSQRQVQFLHACRDAEVQAFGPQVRYLVSGMRNARAFVVHESAHEPEQLSIAPDAVGRLDMATSPLPLPADADHYLCGPQAFMAAQMASLLSIGVPPHRIHAEVFGTGGLRT